MHQVRNEAVKKGYELLMSGLPADIKAVHPWVETTSDLTHAWTVFAHELLVGSELGISRHATKPHHQKGIKETAALLQRRLDGNEPSVESWGAAAHKSYVSLAELSELGADRNNTAANTARAIALVEYSMGGGGGNVMRNMEKAYTEYACLYPPGALDVMLSALSTNG